MSRDARSGGGTYHYPRDPEGKLVARRSSSFQHYYLFDGLGSVVGLATTSGTLADNYRYTYDPYGNQTSAPPALANPWRYAGGLAMDDITTGTKLTKFGARYYDPSVGRWTQQDAVAGSIGDPGSMNRYVYVGGDPVNFLDPDGYFKIPPWLRKAGATAILLNGLACYIRKSVDKEETNRLLDDVVDIVNCTNPLSGYTGDIPGGDD